MNDLHADAQEHRLLDLHRQRRRLKLVAALLLVADVALLAAWVVYSDRLRFWVR